MRRILLVLWCIVAAGVFRLLVANATVNFPSATCFVSGSSISLAPIGLPPHVVFQVQVYERKHIGGTIEVTCPPGHERELAGLDALRRSATAALGHAPYWPMFVIPGSEGRRAAFVSIPGVIGYAILSGLVAAVILSPLLVSSELSRRRRVREESRRQGGLCATCGYGLPDKHATTCPECGTLLFKPLAARHDSMVSQHPPDAKDPK